MSKQPWALILGSSTAFGEATALELARTGMNVVGVYMDRRDRGPQMEQLQEKIQELGREAEFYNGNAADDAVRQRTLEKIHQRIAAQGTLRVLLHAIDGGGLPPLAGAEQVATRRQIEGSTDLMGHSLVYWVQDCLRAGLFDWGGRIFAIVPARAVAARAVMEAHIRQLAVDLAPAGITANTIRPGNTEPPQRNPHRRLTVPDDVARCIAALCHPATYWMTGNTLLVDGGENIVG